MKSIVEACLIIQILTPVGLTPPTVLSFAAASVPTPVLFTPESDTGYSVFGITTFFPFSITISKPLAFNTFTISGYGPPEDYRVQTSAFVVPSLSSASSTNTTTIIKFTVATFLAASYPRNLFSRTAAPKVRVQVPVSQMGTLSPKITTFDDVLVVKRGTKTRYDLWVGSVDVGTPATGPLSIAVLDHSGKEIDTLFL
jgi:hypothetical protein